MSPNVFHEKNGQHIHIYLKKGQLLFCKTHSDSARKFEETFLMETIFAIFGGRAIPQRVGIPMGTNCAPILSDLFLDKYEADFIHVFLKKNEKKLVFSLNFPFRYIDGVISLKNCTFGDLFITSIPLSWK